MKLSSLMLRNFQVHRAKEIQFSPAITTIRGATDAGKSSILRALRWVCLNDLAGEAFITEGEKETGITLTVVPDYKGSANIIRTKGKDNAYFLGKNEFKSFGQGIPAVIGKILSMQEINFQAQYDSPFWFSETAGEVSRQLNTVIDLSVIDTALSNVGSKLRTANERKELCAERLQKAKESLAQINHERIDDFELLAKRQGKLEAVETRITDLQVIVQRIEKNQQEIESFRDQVEQGNKVITQYRALQATEDSISDLEYVLLQIHNSTIFATPPPDFTLIQQLFTQWCRLHNQAKELEGGIKMVRSLVTKSKTLDDNLVEAENEFHSRTKGMICPLCKQPTQ